MELLLIGVIFEAIIIVIASFFLLLVFKKYYEKRQRLTLYLLIIILTMVMSIIFSWLSKVVRLYSGLDYIVNDSVSDPGTPLSWFLLRIVAFRFCFLFITIAIVFSYILKVNLFGKGYNKIHETIVSIFGIFIGFYLLIVYQKGAMALELVAFLLVFVYMAMIYIPFMLSSIKAYKSVNEPIYKKAFLSLAIMAFSFMMILLNTLLDRLLMIFGSPGYTIFYFLAWIFATNGIVFSYLGYIKPKSHESQ